VAPGEGLRCSSGPGLVRLPVPGESSPSALGRLRTVNKEITASPGASGWASYLTGDEEKSHD